MVFRFSAHELTSGLAGHNVTVIGDIIVDHHYYVKMATERVHRSPGGNYPIYEAVTNNRMVGGAAMVAATIRALGCNGSCIGVVGNDDYGKALIRQLKAFKVPSSGIVRSRDRNTTVKLRGCHRHGAEEGFHIMWRVDSESRASVVNEATIKLLEVLEQEKPFPHVIVLEDHEKGVLTPVFVESIFELANRHGCAVIVSPKFEWSKYSGYQITAMAPSYDEFCRGLALDEIDGGPTLDQIASALDRWPKVNCWVIPKPEGTVLVTKNLPHNYRGELYKTDPVTTHPDLIPGCGAAFTAAFACGFASQEDPIKATLLATLVAARQARHKFGSVVHLADVAGEISQCRITHVKSVFSSTVGRVCQVMTDLPSVHTVPTIMRGVARDSSGKNAELQAVIQRFVSSHSQFGLFIGAPPRSGKSHMIERFLADGNVRFEIADATKIGVDFSRKLSEFMGGQNKVLVLDEFLKAKSQMLVETGPLASGILKINGSDVPLGAKKIIAISAVEDDRPFDAELSSRFSTKFRLPNLSKPIDHLNVFGVALAERLPNGVDPATITIDRFVLAAALLMSQVERFNAGQVAGLAASLAGASRDPHIVNAESWLSAGLEQRWVDLASESGIDNGNLVLEIGPGAGRGSTAHSL